MGIVLAFVPFILFVTIERLLGVKTGLAGAAIVSAALLARNLIRRKKSVKVLEVGTTTLFGVLAVFACFSRISLPAAVVRLCVDAGLLLVVLISIAFRRPFTLQYAREQVDPQLWNRPEFVRVNYVITAAWALAFMVMVTSDLVMLCVRGAPTFAGIIAAAAAIAGAVRFTSWYPTRGRHN